MLPQLLKIAAEKDVEFRRSLPINYMRFTGVAFEDSKKVNYLFSGFIFQIMSVAFLE